MFFACVLIFCYFNIYFNFFYVLFILPILQCKQIFKALNKVLRVPVEQAVQMLSGTPAKITKINDKIGTIEVGKRAGIYYFYT